MTNFVPFRKTVRLGDPNLYSNDDGVTPLNLQIEQILISPKYNSKTHQNDIAILVLQLPVEFTGNNEILSIAKKKQETN